LLAELLVKLTWTEEKDLKDAREDRYIKVRIARSVLESFEKYDFWLMRYRDVVQEGYEKVKYEEDSDDEDDTGGKFGRR
jgi:hypothetical protein